MHTYLVILRILHIACGVFWSGTAFLLVFYIFPAVKRAGPDGGKILKAITGTNQFPLVIAITAGVTVLSGFLLMYQFSDGFRLRWFESKYGMSMAIGGTTATVAFLQVVFINLPCINRSQKIMARANASGGAASENQQRELMKLRSRLVFSTQFIAFWLLIAVIAMAGARYV
jgi:uncharacterized membrane protein